MTQLSMMAAGPGWYSVQVDHIDGNGLMGWCGWYESEDDARHAGERTREGRKGGRVTIRPWHEDEPRFARERRAEWDAAARGVPLVVGRYGVRDSRTNRRYQEVE